MHIGFRVARGGRLDLHAVFIEADGERARAAPDDGDLHHALIAARVPDAVGALVFHVAVAKLVKGLLKGNRLARARAAADILIHAVIALGALVPREILLHAAHAQAVKHRLVAEIELDGLRNGQIQILRLIIRKREAVADAVKILIGAHGVLEAARLVDDRHGAVAHGHHLRQAARLKPRGHQVHIRAREHGAGRRLVVIAGETELPRPLRLRPVEILNVLRVALAEHDELNAHIHQLRQNLADQLDALLLNQPRDAGQQRPLALLIQPEQALDLALAARLAGSILDGEVIRHERVALRVVMRHVDAVEDAVELVIHQIDHTLQAVGKVGIVQFARVGRGNGRHRVRHQHRALHQVDILPPLKFIAQAAVVPAGRQGEGRFHFAFAELPLIGDVVNGIHRLDPGKLRPQHRVVFEVQNRQRRFPVVAMQNIGQRAKFRQQVDHRAAEEREPQRIVAIAVQARPVEEMLVADGVYRHAVQRAAVQRAGEVALAERDGTGLDQFKLIAAVFLRDAIHRGDDGHVVARFLKGRGEGKRHIRQTAGFAEGGTFA